MKTDKTKKKHKETKLNVTPMPHLLQKSPKIELFFIKKGNTVDPILYFPIPHNALCLPPPPHPSFA